MEGGSNPVTYAADNVTIHTCLTLAHQMMHDCSIQNLQQIL